jgi:hypothetical protein
VAVNRTRKALLAQGAYYVGTGVAPFVSRRAFAAATGPKREWWLVETVGLLVTAVGGGLISAAARDRVTPELRAIAAGCAAGLAAIDIVYVARGRIAPSYLVDAAIEISLALSASPRGPSARGRAARRPRSRPRGPASPRAATATRRPRSSGRSGAPSA